MVNHSARRRCLPLLGIVAIAAIVRCHYLAEVSYDFDEAFTWKMTTFPASEIWTRVSRDNHPPLFFYLLKGWSLVFGDSLGAMRSLNLALGLLTVIGAYLLVRQIGRGAGNMSDVPPLAATALVALSPYQVDFSQQIRMGYVLGAAWTTLSCWLLLRAIQKPIPRWRDYAWYALAAAALAYAHHFALFILAAHFLYAVGCVLFRGRESIEIRHRSYMLVAFALIVLFWLPWAPKFLRQRRQVSELFHTKPFSWNEVTKASYQTALAVRWEDDPPSAGAACGATVAYLLPAAAMLVWGRGGLRLLGLGVLVTFDGAICTSICDRNIIQARYFVFANVLWLCGLPPLLLRSSNPSERRQKGATSGKPRARFGSVSGGAALLAVVTCSAWACLAHAQRREGFARRPGMMGAMAYLSESRLPGEPVLVCNPLLQVTAAAHAGGGPSQAVPANSSTRRAGKPILQVLSEHRNFPYFQGTSVMREEDYLSPDALEKSSARRVWVIDASNWIIPEWRLSLPQSWVERSEIAFPEGAAAGNGRIIVRCYQRR